MPLFGLVVSTSVFVMSFLRVADQRKPLHATRLPGGGIRQDGTFLPRLVGSKTLRRGSEPVQPHRRLTE